MRCSLILLLLTIWLTVGLLLLTLPVLWHLGLWVPFAIYTNQPRTLVST